MATGCAHADHVNTQLAYAAVTGVSALFGFVIAGFTGSVAALGAALLLQVFMTVVITRWRGVPIGRSRT